MRRYFYLITLLFSFSVSSQDVNDEIIGKWVIKDVKRTYILCYPPSQIYFDKLFKPIINTKLEFTKSGLLLCSHLNNKNEFLRFNNSKWLIDEDESIEIQSLEGKTLLILRFKEKSAKKYYLRLVGVDFQIERIKD